MVAPSAKEIAGEDLTNWSVLYGGPAIEIFTGIKEMMDKKKNYCYTGRDQIEYHKRGGLYQGWKIHVSAYVDETSPVGRSLAPYLLDNEYQHKVSGKEMLERLEGTQEGKFITIYPPVSDRVRDEVIEDGRQVFKDSLEEFNRKSINANQDTTATIIDDLVKILDKDNILEGGPRIEGKNGEETRIGDTRVHYRYGLLYTEQKPLVICNGEKSEPASEGLLNLDAEVAGGSYEPHKVDGIKPPPHSQ